MAQAQSRPIPLDARKFAAIAAECAQVCGVDVRLTPLNEVRIQVGQAMTAPAAPPTCEREIICLGVRFDNEYVIVRLPTGSFRAFKMDAAGRVVLRLEVRGGFRAQVSRVFGALIWDRLKRGVSRYEPQLELLAAEATTSLVTEAAQLEGPDPAPAPRKIGVSNPHPKKRAQAACPEPSIPPERSAPPVLASETEPDPAPGPEPPAPSAPPGPEPAAPARALAPKPQAEGARLEAVPPSPPPVPSASPSEAGAPLARRLRSSRSK
jgi:hypothetical protein